MPCDLELRTTHKILSFKATSPVSGSGAENERFRVANPVCKSLRPETGVFPGFHRNFFSGRPPPEHGSPVSEHNRSCHPDKVSIRRGR